MEILKIIILILFINIFALNCLFPDEIIINYSRHNPENKENDIADESRDEFRSGGHLFFGKIGYSFLGDYNINTGLDLVFFHPRHYTDWEWLGFPKHIIGINYKYQFTEKDSVIKLDYTYVPFLFFTFGLSNSYNINKKEFGVAPKIGLQLFLQIFMLDIDYRYSIIINNNIINRDKNFHEIVFSFSVPLFFAASFFGLYD
jgi:hypothetical protein